MGAQLSTRAATFLGAGFVCAHAGDEINRIAKTSFFIGFSRGMRRSALLNRNGQKMSIAVTKDVQHRYLGQKKAGLPPGLTTP
jgi:hypothetical protein